MESNYERRVTEILEGFPELNDGKCGMYDITALQVVAALSKPGDGIAATRRLVSCGADVNRADFLGRTPLHYAVINGNTALVEVLLAAGANANCSFKYQKVNSTLMKEEIERWRLLMDKLPPPEEWGRTPLHVAVKYSHIDIVRLLLVNGANVNAKDAAELTPLLLAGNSKQDQESFENIIQILVENGANVNVKNNITGTTALLHAVALKSLKATEVLLKAGAWIQENLCKQTELHEAASKGLADILQVFLNDSRMTVQSINKVDDKGRNALYRAAFGGYKQCVHMLIQKGANLAQVTTDGETAADAIFRNIAKPKDFLNDIFNSQIILNDSNKCTVDFCVTVDFSTLAPFGEKSQMTVLSHILSAVNDEEKIGILQHPLIETYLRLKWTRIRPFFLLQLFAHILFVLSLSTYSLLIIQQATKMEVALVATRLLLTITSSGLLFHNLIQCALAGRKLFWQYELWMNFCCISVSLAVAVAVKKPPVSGVPPWILHATSIAVLLAWIELMLLIGRFPTYGYYALMFSVVLRNVIKVLSTFTCLIIGFALSFSIQFYDVPHFTNPWKSAVKTVTMMMGEYEYSDLFGNYPHAIPRLVATSRVIFLLFIILASIVLMNLMVGVAVNDIQALQIEGHAKRLEKQAEFIRQLEKVISLKVLRCKWFPQYTRKLLRQKCCIKTQLVMYPEMRWSWKNKSIFKVLPCSLVDKIINVGLSNRENNEGEDSKCVELDKLMDTLNLLLQKFERRQSTLTEDQAKIGQYRSKRRKISFQQI